MDGAFSAVFIIFGIVIALGLGRYWRHKMRLAEMQFQAEKTYNGEFKQDIDNLRERVVALETIVTGKGYNLNDEIEKLKS